MKIDIHAHILPKTWPDLKARFGYGGFIWMDHHKQGAARMMRDDGTFFREVQENCWNPELIVRDMDDHSVDATLLCTVPVLFNYQILPEHGAYWARFLNDHIADVQTHSRGRLFGLGTLPMQDISLAIEELGRCMGALGLKGVQIATNINDRNLDDPVFFPFFETAERLGACILVHPWEMLGEKSIPKYFMPWLVAMPAETSRAICAMIFGGVFDRFPNLKVLFSHGGGAFPFTLGRISKGYKARPDLCAVNGCKEPKAYLGNILVDSITHDAAALHYIVDLLGADRVLLGTDYPFPLGDLEHGRFIEEAAGFSGDEKRKILGDNARRWLGI